MNQKQIKHQHIQGFFLWDISDALCQNYEVTFISTTFGFVEVPEFLSCVNALNGLTFISTRFGIRFVLENDMCQCPQRAYFHFYMDLFSGLRSSTLCQCPQRAYFHFYGSALLYRWTVGSVSMPSTGLLSFLRYPLGTLDFSGFRELFLQVINRIFCKLLFLLLFLCLSKNLSAHTLLSYALIALLSINSYYNFQIVTIQRLAGHEKTDGVD